MLQMLAFKSVVHLTVASSFLLFKKIIYKFFEYCCLLNAWLILIYSKECLYLYYTV